MIHPGSRRSVPGSALASRRFPPQHEPPRVKRPRGPGPARAGRARVRARSLARKDNSFAARRRRQRSCAGSAETGACALAGDRPPAYAPAQRAPAARGLAADRQDATQTCEPRPTGRASTCARSSASGGRREDPDGAAGGSPLSGGGSAWPCAGARLPGDEGWLERLRGCFSRSFASKDQGSRGQLDIPDNAGNEPDLGENGGLDNG